MSTNSVKPPTLQNSIEGGALTSCSSYHSEPCEAGLPSCAVSVSQYQEREQRWEKEELTRGTSVAMCPPRWSTERYSPTAMCNVRKIFWHLVTELGKQLCIRDVVRARRVSPNVR